MAEKTVSIAFTQPQVAMVLEGLHLLEQSAKRGANSVRNPDIAACHAKTEAQVRLLSAHIATLELK